MKLEKRLGIRLLVVAIVLVAALAGGCRLGPVSSAEKAASEQQAKARPQFEKALRNILIRHGYCPNRPYIAGTGDSCGGRVFSTYRYAFAYNVYGVNDPAVLSELKAEAEKAFNENRLIRHVRLTAYKFPENRRYNMKILNIHLRRP